MTLKRLIEFFEISQKAPVEIKDVRDQCIESYGVQDEVSFQPLEMDPDLVLGIMVRYIKRDLLYGEPKRCALIIYNNAVSVEWQRLACCKEIVHLFDKPALLTNTRDLAIKLIHDLTEGSVLSAIGHGTWQSIKDTIAVHQALAVLFPDEMRDDLMGPYERGEIGDEWIAKKFCIPEGYVEFLMSDRWPEYRKTLMEI